MNFDSFQKLVTAYANTKNLTAFELYYSRSISQSFNSFGGEIENVSHSSSEGVCFRCLKNGKMGYSSTELYTEDEAKRLVDDAISALEIIESDDEEFIFKGAENYAEPLKIDKTMKKPSEHIKDALEIEKICKEKDSRIYAVPYAMTTEGVGETRIINSYGLDLSDEGHMFGMMAQTTAVENEDVKSGFSVSFGRNYNDVSIDKVCEEAVKTAVDSLGASAVPSGKYKTVLSNLCMCDLISTFSSIFSAAAAQKGLSLLKDKEGEKIASDIVTLIDDPRCEKSCTYATFDAEGVPTKLKNVIENGVLKTLLHNLRTANKAGVESTGNAYKGSYVSKVSVAPFSLYIKEGEDDLEKILDYTQNGLYITDLSGLHAGADSISGDFSLAASGFLIENGKKTKAVNSITLAGNFFALLKDIEKIGSDLRFSMPSGGQFGSPCVVVKNLTVAGE